ncbi:MAG: BON domain-containing protein [Deltaproteobacteria bacterium]|nr:BON domain-containing protein [Nannocystaceae bacterium]
MPRDDKDARTDRPEPAADGSRDQSSDGDNTSGREGAWQRGNVAFRGAGQHAATPVRNPGEMRVPPEESRNEPGALQGDRFDASGGYSEDRANRQPNGPGAREQAKSDPERTPSGHRGEQTSEYGRGRDGGMPGRTGGESAGSGAVAETASARPSGRGKGPKNFTRSDERILEDVCQLLQDSDVDASHVEVRVSQGEVTLEGTVDDEQSKQAAQETVQAASGVKRCHNLLRIGER